MANMNISADKLQQLKTILAEKSVADEFGALNNSQEMQEFLKARGLELTPEEIYNAAVQIASENADELDEDMLDAVAGGKTISFWIFEINLEKPKWWPW